MRHEKQYSNSWIKRSIEKLLGTKWAQFGHEMGTDRFFSKHKKELATTNLSRLVCQYLDNNYIYYSVMLFSARQTNLFVLVGVRGFEPPAPASRTQCSTRLSYTPMKVRQILQAPNFRLALLRRPRLILAKNAYIENPAHSLFRRSPAPPRFGLVDACIPMPRFVARSAIPR